MSENQENGKLAADRRVVLVNPTKHLGNLLVSLGLIQHACAHWRQQGTHVLLVFDETYRNLLGHALAGEHIVYYPRKAIESAVSWRKLFFYLGVVAEIRRFRAQIALDMEGDSVSSLLTRLSGASQRIGSYEAKYPRRYHRLSRPRPQPHEYYKYHQVIATQFPLDTLPPHYGKVSAVPTMPKITTVIDQQIAGDKNRVIAIHAGATKTKKMWPVPHFSALIQLLRQAGYTVVLIGAGSVDKEVNEQINRALTEAGDKPVIDLCNQLSLLELIDFLKRCCFYIGNDSGPMHLASALHVPGIALFGASNEKLWGPLSTTTDVMRGQACEPDCNRGYSCRVNYRCLAALIPQQVAARVKQRLA